MGFETGYTGHLMEREMFGEVDKKKHLKEIAGKDYLRDMDYFEDVKRSNISENSAIRSVKNCQTYDNVNPKPRFARDLRKKVENILKLENPSDLKLFTAVHSYLDFCKSTDAFIELAVPKGKFIRVTLNTTYNPNHVRGREDILFFMPKEGLDPESDKEEYEKKIEEVADYIIAKIESKKVDLSFL